MMKTLETFANVSYFISFHSLHSIFLYSFFLFYFVKSKWMEKNCKDLCLSLQLHRICTVSSIGFYHCVHTNDKRIETKRKKTNKLCKEKKLDIIEMKANGNKNAKKSVSRIRTFNVRQRFACENFANKCENFLWTFIMFFRCYLTWGSVYGAV